MMVFRILIFHPLFNTLKLSSPDDIKVISSKLVGYIYRIN